MSNVIIPLKFSSWNITLWTKRAHRSTSFQTFKCFNKSLPNSSCQFWNHKVKDYSNLASLFSVMRDNSSVLFSWKCTWFGQKEPINVQTFRLSTVHAKFHQLCTLIDSFCWKYIKFKLQRYIAVMSHDSEIEAKFEEKLICCFKNDKNLVNFELSTQKSQKFALSLVPIVQRI